MNETTIKMTAPIVALLTAVRDGASYRGAATSYIAAKAAGWLEYENPNHRRENGEWGRGYILTEAGTAALAAKLAPKSAKPHANNCKCPRCQVAHVANGCRRINCPVCG